MPDLFDGDAVSLNHAGDFDFMNWLSKDPAERVDQIVEGTIRHLRGKMSVDRVGGLGYCFGAKVSPSLFRCIDRRCRARRSCQQYP